MKKIAFVPPYQAEEPSGEPAVNANREPVMMVHYDFLRERTVASPAFVDKLEGFEAQQLVYETRVALKKQISQAAARGYWLLEDEPAKRMLEAVNKGPYHQQIAFNAIPFMRAVREMTDYEEPAVKAESSNGASAQAS